MGLETPVILTLNTDYYRTYVKLVYLMSIAANLKVNRIGGN